MVRALGETGRPLPRQVVLDQELAGERKHQGDDRDRNRAPYSIWRDDQCNACLGASIDIDRIVADTKTGHGGKPATFRHATGIETVGEQDQRIEILQLFAAQWIVGLKKRHLDVRCGTQRPQIEIGISR